MILLLRTRSGYIPNNVRPQFLRRLVRNCGPIHNEWGYPAYDGFWWRSRQGSQFHLYWNHDPTTKDALRQKGYEVIFGGRGT